ncbi:3-hydroxyisobutyrate dehydrogenase [Tamaricihabitans halophyticus]|uniref:3-hydroxyisobutyrate dehydrogenase n=1 Tax=Tamaricihabitans halophyticus TaxID=1262583 RepID=A0A4R2PTG3_9PSEU|nr:NAD(P)-dependent oxidoreductase [Tamaricihabitans halophyticus]TCP39179.1 3-hydroxyisobutyrate dehydrogenase [Tamaricihabitans halophyticus]
MKVGFIGLGKMGAGMVRNVAAKFSVTAYDAQSAAVRAAVSAGAMAGESAADTASDADVLVTMLPGPREIEAVMLGDGVASALKPGAIWVDMSSSSLETLRRIVSAHPDGGWTVLDAPVTGGVPGAEAGTLQVFAGGSAEDFERAAEVLASMANPERILHVGEQGAGYAVKLCLNLGFFLHAMAGAEVLALGVKAGVDLRLLHDALVGSGASSAFLENDAAQNVFAGDYKEYFRLALAMKDVRLAVDLGREVGVPLELSAIVEQLMCRAYLTYGDGGQLLAVKQLEETAGIELRRD